jgi:dienelactone hydrolase
MQAMRPRNALVLVVVLAAVVAISAPALRSYTRAAALIIRMANIQGLAHAVAAWEQEGVTVSGTTVPSRSGPLRAIVYMPTHPRRAVILVAGVNALGIDEPRLVGLAMQLSQIGFAVVTPELPDLQRYEITPRTTDMIEDAAAWLSSNRALARDGRVGMVGISFAGGLSVVAAGRPALRNHVAFVFSFGGHADLPRVLRFLCTGMEPVAPGAAGTGSPGLRPAETYRKPHDYGVAILLKTLADRLVPPEQVGPLQASILQFLHASHMDLIDKAKAAEEFAAARTVAGGLPEPAKTLMSYVNERRVDLLGPKLLPFIGPANSMSSLSPDRSPAPSAPVYLLHGTDDNVVPAVESLMMARYLSGKTATRTLLSSLITHAELDRTPTVSEVWNLVSFFAEMLRR